MVIMLSLAFAPDSAAQLFKKKTKTVPQKVEANKAVASTPVPKASAILHYKVDEYGDTLFVETLKPCYIYAWGTKHTQGNRINWRDHYKLVFNFNKVYPYALMGRRLVQRIDAQIASGELDKKERKQMIDDVQDDIIKEFESVVRHMSITQGQLLCRLVDREIGKTSYLIVKDYKSSFAAGFWQGVAKIFRQDLKAAYDPNGQDFYTEELIKEWERGEFDYIYLSLFGNWPERTYIPSQYR